MSSFGPYDESEPKLAAGHRPRSRFVPFLSVQIVSVFMVCAALIYFILSIGKPYLGIDLISTSTGWTVVSVDANGIPGKMGVNQGDTLVIINGLPAGQVLEKFNQSGTVVAPYFKEITISNDEGRLIDIDLDKSSLSWEAVTQQLALAAISLILWAVGFYVFTKKPTNIAASLLCLFAALVGISLSGSLATVVEVPAAGFVHVIASVIAPWLLVHFLLVLPEERLGTRRNPFIYLVYLPAAVTLILLPIVGWDNGQPVQWFRTVRLFGYAAGFLGAGIVAAFNYYHSKSLKTKQQMRIVFLSSLIALVPVLLLMVIPFALFRETLIPPGISILFVGFIPLGMGYAVIVERLMDIDVVVRRSIVYALITLLMSAVLSLALFAAVAFPAAFGSSENVLLALAAGLLASFLFGPIKDWAEKVVDKLFYKDRYDYRQTINALSSSLKLLKDPAEMARVIVGTSVRTLNLTGGCLFVFVSGSYEIGAGEGNLGTADMLDQVSEFVYMRNRRLEFPNSATPDNPNLSFIIPLVTGEKELGLLYLSHKASKQEFSSNDMYLLQGIASVGAMALNGAMLIRDVSVRDTFVSIASHELRTPLTAVIGYADLLLRRDTPEPTRRQWLQIILDSGLKIADMADDLLDVSRIRSGKIALKIEKIQLPALLSEQAAAAGVLSDKHKIILDAAPDLQEVYADKSKFSQILANLLNNAVKYSPNGGRITLSAKNQPEQGRVIVSVTDEGLGISPADQASLFKTFNRIQRQETIGIRGIGLGLYIVKEWTEAMNGKVWLESELDKGSTFYVSVPTQPAEKAISGH